MDARKPPFVLAYLLLMSGEKCLNNCSKAALSFSPTAAKSTLNLSVRFEDALLGAPFPLELIPATLFDLIRLICRETLNFFVSLTT